MKNVLRNAMGILGGALLLSPAAIAAELICDGNWQVTLHSDSVAETSRNNIGSWIPATISLDRQLASCAQGITFKQSAGGPLELRGSVANQGYELASGSRQKLKNNGKDQYWMPLTGKQKVDFWLYLPKGRHMLPGLYQGVVDMQLATSDTAQTLQKTHTFSHLVKPFVRAKLQKNSHNWLPSSGTSVRLDLGDLTRANSVELPVYLDSNGFVTMSVKSENQGKLTLVNDAKHQIPYEFKLTGRSLPLQDETIVDVGHRAGGEQRVDLSFHNQAAPFARAGTYEDIVTISMWAR